MVWERRIWKTITIIGARRVFDKDCRVKRKKAAMLPDSMPLWKALRMVTVLAVSMRGKGMVMLQNR